MRSELCACGDWLIARNEPTAVLAEVRRHNAGTAHRLWRARRRAVEATRAYKARLRREVETVRLERWVAA